MPVKCPTLETLVAQAVGDDNPALAQHVATCPTCREEVTRLRETVAQLRAGTPPRWTETPHCLDEMAIAAFLDGMADAAARAATVAHLVSCARCRAAVASVGEVVGQEAVLTGAATRASRGSWRRWRVPLAAAAAATLVVFAWQCRAEERGPAHRAPPITVTVPVPISPIGTVAGAGVLRWASVPGSDRYRVTLFDTTGQVLYEAKLDDTVAALPDSVVLVPGRLYLWQAEARTEWDRWSRSGLIRFSVASGPPR